MKGKHKNYIKIEYNFEKCYIALLDQLDWVNSEGNRIPHDLSKPLPLHGASGRLTILVDYFFNKDLEYLTIGNVEKKYANSLIKLKVTRHDLEGIKEMIPQLWSSSKVAYDKDVVFGIIHWDPNTNNSTDQDKYGYLKEIVVRRAN
ncbi:hypothetical protein Tco_0839470 [Tanacetum coccineum]|uniref:Uncharacterized protein n=1 Tax=Tanacetum coccineum TaxID=301880 RepID=A0ABQ5AUN4_9ASTR